MSIAPASSLVMWKQAMEILWGAQTEIIVFIVAFVTHAMLVGKHRVPNRKSMPAKCPLPEPCRIDCHKLSPHAPRNKAATKATPANVTTYSTFVKAHLQNGSLNEARKVIDCTRKAGLQPNCVTFNELVGAAIKVSVDRAWDIIEEMGAWEVKPNRITCSILLKTIQQNSSSADVIRILNVVDDMDDEIDDILVSATIEAIIRSGRPDVLAMHLQKQWSSGKTQIKSPHTIGSFIRAHGHLGDIDGVWNIWCDMRKRHITPTSITLGCMVEALTTNGNVDVGYEVLQQMLKDPQCSSLVNAVIFGSVLKGFSHQKSFDRVWSTYQEMMERRLDLSVITFNTLVDACARCREMGRIPDVLDKMREQGIEPNLITYSTVIKGYCQENKLKEALQVWEAMVLATDLQPDEIMYNTILDGCARQGLYAKGMSLLDEMRKSGIRPSNFTLSVLVKMASRAKLLDRAFEICKELSRTHKIKLNVHVYSNLVQACATNNAMPRAFEVLEQMVREGVSPDVRTYTLLIKACIAAGRAKDCSGLVRAALGLENGHPILAKSASFARLQNGLPCDLLVASLEGISGRCDNDATALALWQAIKLTPGLKLPSRLQLRLAAQLLSESVNGDGARVEYKK